MFRRPGPAPPRMSGRRRAAGHREPLKRRPQHTDLHRRRLSRVLAQRGVRQRRSRARLQRVQAIAQSRPSADAARVAVTADGRQICERCVVADSPRVRMRGLLGRHGLDPGEGMLIRPTNAIHMWFMRFPIDAVFLAQDGTVLRIAADQIGRAHV